MAENKPDFRNEFFAAKEYFKRSDYQNAKHYFEISMNDPSFHEKSLAKLIQIDLKEGKYENARRTLVENSQINSSYLTYVYGLLENIENNFEQSKKYYGECMQFPEVQYKSLLGLAKIHVQMGDYDIAQKMYETLLLDKNHSIQASFGLIYLYMLKQDFISAQKILYQIDNSILSPKLSANYRIIDIYLKYFLGQLKQSDKTLETSTSYITYRLFDKSDETLIKHIDRHKNQNERFVNGCFFKYTDTLTLLKEARDIIQDMNANHFEISDMYRFRLDAPIGYKGEEMTCDICAVTMIGTKDIITMYPVKLSDDFDKEGFAKSEELRLKRTMKGRVI